MPSLVGMFPDARLVLSLDPEQLAGLTLTYFRNLPWRDARAVRRCITHWVEPYPNEFRTRVADALMATWEHLRADGRLDVPVARVPSDAKPNANVLMTVKQCGKSHPRARRTVHLAGTR